MSPNGLPAKWSLAAKDKSKVANWSINLSNFSRTVDPAA
jgi:hypothetical protein